jgi:hypothetical protein
MNPKPEIDYSCFRIEGVRCPCGNAELVIGSPGTDATLHPTIGMLERPAPARAWCCLEHARADGWPWLISETPRKGRAA